MMLPDSSESREGTGMDTCVPNNVIFNCLCDNSRVGTTR